MSQSIEPITVQIRHVPSDHRRSVRANRRTQLLWARILGGGLGVTGLIVTAANDDLVFVGLALFILGILLLVRSWLLPWSVVWRLPASAYLPHRVDIDGEGIRWTAEHESVAMSWSGFASARRDRQQWVLHNKHQGPPTMIARRHFTAEQESRLDAMLRMHGLVE